ncbi:unnamed protein product [Mytilus coruscus]|uniref:Uncharacterized protein n=1 Tax=Mytilus coruscus TaxID=42192 RepID=A0A6J8C472_MYTCO|nr:unnamed protein product [Mytilus coruscus]
MSKEISLNSGNTYKEYWPFVNYSIAITSSLHQYQDFFVKLNTANVYKNYDTMTLTINQEKSGNSDFFLSLLTSVQPVDQHLGFILQILLYYLTKKKKSVLNSNAIIQDNIHKVVRWIVKNFVASIVNEKDEITNKYSGKKYEKSEAQPKTDLTINIYRNECDEMKAHSMRLREKKYDLQIYLPVFVGNNSKENIFSSDILLKYQLLIRELLMCKFVYINPAIPMSVLVAYLILSTITINEAEVSKLRKCFILKYSYKDAADRLLWISHDVEKNPGPVGESFSEKLRPVTQNLYAKLLNIFEGKQTKKIPNNLCTKQADFYLYDHSAEKVYSCTYKSIEKEALIDILIACCQQKKFDITDLKEEVLAWTSCKFESLFQLHSISIASEKLSSHLLRTTQHAERVAIDKKMEEFGVKLNHTTFQNWLSNNPIVQNRKKADLCWEACRYIDSILCKYINKEYKRGEYYSTPPDWPPEYEKYQDPYNNKNGHDIRKFFKDLLRYCSNRDPIIGIPQEFKSYIKACEAWIKDTKKQEDLLEEYVLHHDVNIISENLSFLQTKSMLTDRDIGLLSLFSFQSYTTSNSRVRF